MNDRKESYSIIDRILKYCSYYTMVRVDSYESGISRFSNSQLHQNIVHQDTYATITAIDGKRRAQITTNLLEEADIRDTVKRLEENLSFMPEDEIAIPELYEPKEIIQDEHDPRISLFYDVSGRTGEIKRCLSMLDSDFTAAGILALNMNSISMGNNRGVRRYERIDTVLFNILIMHIKGSSGYAQCFSSNYNDIDIIGKFQIASKKAIRGIINKELEPGRYTVILEPLAVAGLLNNMSVAGFSAKNVQDGSSFLCSNMGKSIFGSNITIVDDPLSKDTIPSYFDYEGYERKKLDLIVRGIPGDLAYDARSAAKDGTVSNGHSLGDSQSGGVPENMIMSGGDSNIDELISSTEYGILITRFHYINVVDSRNAVFTGLTRDGTYLIKEGKIQCGIKNLRFTDSLFNIFNNVSSITSNREKVPSYSGACCVPAIKVEKFCFTSKTTEE